MEKKTFITQNYKQTQELGGLLAKEIIIGKGRKGSTFSRSRLNIESAFIICLSGDLGSGKTTFAQGFLKGLGLKGPHTSPTFLVIKNYQKEIPNPKSQIPNKSKLSKPKTQNIYHIDAYRVKAKDILNLGWKEIISGGNIVLVEWADRIKKIIPRKALWIKFEWVGPPRLAKDASRPALTNRGRRDAGKNKRRIIFK